MLAVECNMPPQQTEGKKKPSHQRPELCKKKGTLQPEIEIMSGSHFYFVFKGYFPVEYITRKAVLTVFLFP